MIEGKFQCALKGGIAAQMPIKEKWDRFAILHFKGFLFCLQKKYKLS